MALGPEWGGEGVPYTATRRKPPARPRPQIGRENILGQLLRRTQVFGTQSNSVLSISMFVHMGGRLEKTNALVSVLESTPPLRSSRNPSHQLTRRGRALMI